MPLLGSLMEIHDAVGSLPLRQTTGYLGRANFLLEEATQALGPLDIWCGKSRLAEKKLTVVAGQLLGQVRAIRLPKDAPEKFLGTRSMNRKAEKAPMKREKSDAKKCQSCERKFTLLVRRQRCRRCTGDFCWSCCWQSDAKAWKKKAKDWSTCQPCGEKLQQDMKDAQSLREAAGKKDKDNGADLPTLPRMLRAFKPMGFLSVHVQGLAEVSFQKGSALQMYVRLRISDRDWIRTSEVMRMGTSVAWSQDLFFPVQASDNWLSMEVCVVNREGEDQSLGDVTVNIREHAAQEQKRVMKSMLPKTGGGVLAFRFSFAEDAWHLK